MKRFLCLILTLVLCFGMAACSSEPVAPPVPEDRETGDLDDILGLLESEDYEMAIQAIEDLRGDADSAEAEEPEETQTAASQGADQLFELPPAVINSDWLFQMEFSNPANGTIRLESLVITDYLSGQIQREFVRVEQELQDLGMEGLTLEPGESYFWQDGHPIVDFFDARDYRFLFRDSDGAAVSITFAFHMDGTTAPAQPQQPSGSWFFPILLENTEAIPLTLVAMDITDLMNGIALGTAIFEGEEPLAQIGLGDLVLQPGETFQWQDAHPAVSDWNGREYRFHFAEQAGGPWILNLTFRFENLDAQNEPVDYSADHGQDLKTLRHDASFEVEVADGVWWVPAASLGESRYSNAEIFAMLPASPAEKQTSVSTLYEALQLYQVGNFTPSDDNIRSFENGINWEHHKPGYHAVRTNTGCCATDSNWLRYILDGDYNEVGFLATSQPDGSGHVYNYILQDGWYYFVDLTHYHASGSPINTAVENGDLSSYYSTDFILGNIHKVQSVDDYVNYVQNTFNAPPALMFLYTAENVLAVDGNPSQIIYEEANGQQIHVVFDDPADQLEFVRAESPKNFPDWNTIPGHIW